MPDRDDGRLHSPEGKGISDEGKQCKAALAQLTVEGGAPEEKSGKGEPPEPFDINPAMEEEKKKETFDVYAKALRSTMEQKAPNRF